MLETIFIAFIAIVSIQFIYYIIIFGSFSFAKQRVKAASSFNKPVSVIICAKNEAKNLTKHLPLYLNQTYPSFELVLINDRSRDKTLEVLEKFKLNATIPIKIVDVKENEQFWGSKKYALTLGIKAASYEHLLFTDADCKPVSNNWITEMTEHFQQSMVVLGYGAYKTIKGSFLNKIIRFDTLLTSIQYFSLAKIGMPYMGVGKNLAYTKTAFFSVNGFINHMKIKLGEDELFVNEVSKQQAISICYSKNSFTTSKPATTFNNWILQKRRSASTTVHYRFFHKLVLALFYISQLLFWVTGIILLSFLFNWIIVTSLIAARFLFQYLIIGFSAKKLNEKGIVLFAPFFELFLILIQLFIFMKNIVSKPSN
ncbi:MAG: glycosyltransferase [Lutibacter sp.]|nr:glycosyltransferase [Lutibacter sp.]MBP9601209.1 glycosyltransferase [Lutibacter sp.]